MSIYIKGQDLTKEGECYLLQINSDGTVYDAVGRRIAAHAVPVPPHGRLGDLDKQDAQIEALIERHLHGYTKSTWDFVCELRDILKRNHTIIPAEEEHTMEEFVYGQDGNPNDGSM